MRSQCISDSHEHKKEEEGFGHRPADLMRLGEPDREHQGNDCPLWASCTRWSWPVISRRLLRESKMVALNLRWIPRTRSWQCTDCSAPSALMVDE